MVSFKNFLVEITVNHFEIEYKFIYSGTNKVTGVHGFFDKLDCYHKSNYYHSGFRIMNESQADALIEEIKKFDTSIVDSHLKIVSTRKIEVSFNDW